MSDNHPQSIGRYQIVEILGQGGMGSVYRGVHENGGADVAIKIMKGTGNVQEEQRFLAEGRVLQDIHHKHVIRCLDLGECDDGLYMVLDLYSKGDVRGLMEANGGHIPERLALEITRDIASGLQALEDAQLVHRDIKPDNIFISDENFAVLADFGVVRNMEESQRMTQAGMPVGTVAYMAPEQAEAMGKVDCRTDIYAVGATLFAMLTGRPPFLGENPMMTMLMVVNELFPDVRKMVPGCHSGTVQLVNKATSKKRDDRYQSAAEFVEAIQGVLNSLDDEASQRTETNKTEVMKTDLALGSEGSQIVSDKAMLDQLDPAALARVVQRVRIKEDGLTAWINLAPEASFPSVLLRAILDRRGVTYGIREGSLLDASRPSSGSRRVVLAAGDPPSPGCAGKDIFGQQVPPLRDPAQISLNEDLTEAWLLTVPMQNPSREQVQEAIKDSGIRFGIKRDVLKNICEPPASQTGRTLMAQGTPMKEARPDGFVLCDEQGREVTHEKANLRAVHHGDIIAIWTEGEPGLAGMDVMGNPIPVPEVVSENMDSLAGEGTEVGRDKKGRMVLRAAKGGHVQFRVDGVIRVVRLIEIDGDLGITEDGLNSDDVVVVKGSVRSGARISCSNDVVIEGDLEDASIDAGGSIEVHGDIQMGLAPVVGVDAIMVQGNVQRKVVAGNLRVDGKVEHCELVATGDITVKHAIGGSITAGGSVRVAYAGDEFGTATELWAGRSESYEDEARMAQLAERRLAAERERMVKECQILEKKLADEERRSVRIQGAVKKDTFERHQRMLERMEKRWIEAEAMRESSRQQLSEQRRDVTKLGRKAHAEDCEIIISVLARSGVSARLADADPMLIREDRPKLHLRLDE